MTPSENEETTERQAKRIRQVHGLKFEDWLKDTFFEFSHTLGPTAHWDFTGVRFKEKFATELSRYSGKNFSVKTCNVGKALNLGDAIRQFDISVDFVLIVAFWKQTGDSKKVVEVIPLIIDKNVWRGLFGVITREQLVAFDNFVKNNKKTPDVARAEAKEEKKKLPNKPPPTITINQKIDAGVRRVQCSLSYRKFWNLAKKLTGTPTKPSTLWGIEVPDLP